MERMIKMLKVFVATFFFLIPINVGNAYSADQYPNRPITLICGWGAGGMMDVSVRALSKAAEKELGQPIIVENKTGAGGVIANAYVAKAKPDGYTIGVTVTSTYTMQPQMRKTTYNPLTDITDIMTYSRYVTGLAVRADAPWKTIDDVIDYARKNPSKFTYSHGGVGTTQHITMERIAMEQKVQIRQVPFKSGTESVAAVLGGHTDAVAQGPADILQHIKAGKLKMLLALNETRWPEVPDAPTVLEKYKFCIFSYTGIYGPKDLPESIRGKLEQAFKNGMKDPAFVSTLRNGGMEIAYLSGKEYSEKWRAVYKEVGDILNTLGLTEK